MCTGPVHVLLPIIIANLVDGGDQIVTLGLDHEPDGVMSQVGIRPMHHYQIRESRDRHAKIGVGQTLTLTLPRLIERFSTRAHDFQVIQHVENIEP